MSVFEESSPREETSVRSIRSTKLYRKYLDDTVVLPFKIF